MMDRMLLSACSDSDLVSPVFCAMADTNSAFLKFTGASVSLLAEDFFLVDLVVDDFFLAAYIAVAGRAVWLFLMLLAPLSLSGAIDDDEEDDEVMPRSPMDDGGVNASTLLLLVATKRAKITERSVLVILDNNVRFIVATLVLYVLILSERKIWSRCVLYGKCVDGDG